MTPLQKIERVINWIVTVGAAIVAALAYIAAHKPA
jgi:hypothetical protein